MNIEWAKLLLIPFVYLAAVVLAVYLIWLFRLRLRQLLTSLGIKSLKVSGVEIAMSSAEIGKAQQKVGEVDVGGRGELALFAEMATPYIVGSRVLWVDDTPLLNIEERRAFRLLGIEVINCLNTSEAIETLCRDDYDLAISDISRGNILDISRRNILDPTACAEVEGIRRARIEGDDGWKTLSEINRVHGRDRIPVIFYHGRPSEQEERDKRARAEGAVGATTSPAILYRWVLSALLQKAAIRDDELRHLILLIPSEVTQRLASKA